MLRRRGPGRPQKVATPALAVVVPTSSTIAWSPPELGGPHVSQSAMEQAVLQMTHEGRPLNTKIAYDGKTAEFYQFCASLYPNDPFKNNLDHQKVWCFMFYQCMRPQRKRGGIKSRGETDIFVRADYDEVMATYKLWFTNQSQPHHQNQLTPLVLV
jgi:hypothetical protein